MYNKKDSHQKFKKKFENNKPEWNRELIGQKIFFFYIIIPTTHQLPPTQKSFIT